MREVSEKPHNDRTESPSYKLDTKSVPNAFPKTGFGACKRNFRALVVITLYGLIKK